MGFGHQFQNRRGGQILLSDLFEEFLRLLPLSEVHQRLEVELGELVALFIPIL